MSLEVKKEYLNLDILKPYDLMVPLFKEGNDKIAYQDQSDSNYLSDEYRNDCEALVSELHPEIRDAIFFLSKFAKSRLTGTGACCFTRFDSEEQAQQVLNEARSKFKGFIAKGVNLSPAIQRLNEAKSSQ